MRTFKDSSGKEWSIDIHVSSLELVKSVCQVDLTKLFDNQLALFGEVFEDPYKLTSILWALCGTTVAERDDFLKAMTGDYLEDAANVLIECVIDFFPNANRRKLLREMVQKIWATVEKTQSVAEQKLSELIPTSLIPATSSPGS